MTRTKHGFFLHTFFLSFYSRNEGLREKQCMSLNYNTLNKGSTNNTKLCHISVKSNNSSNDRDDDDWR